MNDATDGRTDGRIAPLRRGSLEERLEYFIDRSDGADACHPWRGGVSRGGWREVDYGIIREGSRGSRIYRAHRLVLILKTAPADVPRDDDEPFRDWIRRAVRFYRGQEASHVVCDWSLCCNGRHLAWQSHTANVKDAADRRRQRKHATVKEGRVSGKEDKENVDRVVRDLRRQRGAGLAHDAATETSTD